MRSTFIFALLAIICLTSVRSQTATVCQVTQPDCSGDAACQTALDAYTDCMAKKNVSFVSDHSGYLSAMSDCKGTNAKVVKSVEDFVSCSKSQILAFGSFILVLLAILF